MISGGTTVPKTMRNPIYENPTYVPEPPEVSICTHTYLPNQEGYFKDRWAIIHKSLDSLVKSLEGIDHELIIWDNNSIPEFRDSLRWYNAKIIFCPYNAGGYRPRTGMYKLARGKYITFGEDDLLFEPDWYQKEKEVLEACDWRPCVVGGVPGTRREFPLGAVALRYVEEGKLKVKDRGKLISLERNKELSYEVGHEQYRTGEDILLELHGGVEAYLGGSHMQFLTERETFPIYPEPQTLKSWHWAKTFDRYLMERSVVGLTTVDAVIHHMGNEL
jgi:hypothetical protein